MTTRLDLWTVNRSATPTRLAPTYGAFAKPWWDQPPSRALSTCRLRMSRDSHTYGNGMPGCCRTFCRKAAASHPASRSSLRGSPTFRESAQQGLLFATATVPIHCRKTRWSLLEHFVIRGLASRIRGWRSDSRGSPLTDSNRRPPPYHALRNGCRGLPPVADRLI
jgi:hypothetical protein